MNSSRLGNSLSHNGRCKLFNLEYAKEFDWVVGGCLSVPKTIVMAVELQSEDTIYKRTDFPTKLNDILQTYPVLSPPRVVIRHGVESIFWILSWLLFTHIKGQKCTKIIAKICLSINVHFLSSR